MKKFIYLMIVCLIGGNISAQVGINTLEPKTTLDVQGNPSDKDKLDGIIPPRITGEQLRAKTYGKTESGAVVYVTKPDPMPRGQTINVDTSGLYYFDGTVWVGIITNDTRVAGKCASDPFTEDDNETVVTVGDYNFRWIITNLGTLNNQFEMKKNTTGSTFMISKTSGGDSFQVGASFTELIPNTWTKIGSRLNVDREHMGEIIIHTEENHVFKIIASGIKRKAGDSYARFCYTVEQLH